MAAQSPVRKRVRHARKSCIRCHKIRPLHHRDPALCGGCYYVWCYWGRPDKVPALGQQKPNQTTVDGLADFLVASKRPEAVGKLGGLNYEYVASAIGKSVRTVVRYQAMVRDGHPSLEMARRQLV